MNTFEILRIKEKFKPGMKVRCIEYKDEYSSIPEGTIGLVHHVDDIGTVHIEWENGSHLGAVIGIDEIEIVPQYHIEPIDPIKRNVQLERKQESIWTEPVSVEHAVILDDERYNQFKDSLLEEYDFIKEINQLTENSAEAQVFVVVNESQDEEIIVANEGYDYARYTAHVSDVSEFQIPHFNLSKNMEPMIRVLVVEPKHKPYVAIIENTLEGLQEMVGGLIEEVGLNETASIICNEEGKLLNFPANRRLGNDILVGRFIVVGVDYGEQFK